MKVDAHQRSAFDSTGILSIKHLIPRSRTEPAKDFILRELERLRLRENGKWHTKKLDGVSPFQVAGKIAQTLRHDSVFDAVISAEVVALLTTLSGYALRATQAHPQILVTPPQREAWEIPSLGWHVDITRPSSDVIPGIQVFVLLDDVAPRGGGTMAIQGSHKVRDLDPTPDRVVEMCGKAGDAYLMDMRIRHAPSVNATKQARMMLTSRYLPIEAKRPS